MGKRQAFSTEEFEGRVGRVRQAMAAQGIDVLLLHAPENIYYLTGYQTSGYFAYQVLAVTHEAEPVLLVRYLEKGNVWEYAWLEDARTWREGDDVVAETAALVSGASAARKTIGIEKASWFLTAAVAEGLAGHLPNARLVDASTLVDRLRLVKSPAEIAYLRRAAAIAEEEQRAALAAIRPGVTEADVAAAVHYAGIKAGCEYTGLPHHIMSGYRYDVCHANWSPKVIIAGELVLLELYGCVERYHATQMRTVAIGAPNDTTQHAANLVIGAQDHALSAMRPGASSRAVDAMVRTPLRRVRPDYYNRTGYSTGIGFPPRTAEWQTLDFNEDSDWAIEKGMVFHMLALASGVGFSETVLITATGAERLTFANPRELVTVPA
jgi:Xaa-Pro dipeptidase